MRFVSLWQCKVTTFLRGGQIFWLKNYIYFFVYDVRCRIAAIYDVFVLRVCQSIILDYLYDCRSLKYFMEKGSWLYVHDPKTLFNLKYWLFCCGSLFMSFGCLCFKGGFGCGLFGSNLFGFLFGYSLGFGFVLFYLCFKTCLVVFGFLGRIFGDTCFYRLVVLCFPGIEATLCLFFGECAFLYRSEERRVGKECRL